ncbi:uncharacterized protein LOC111023525 [Momordica charantia]|uniref:Uncharacterized protein LOC111023525 n=1 Tax=Momordica charantia TaxID=3673 RepID=A0A6J1DR92_MOMCH|nr:uncharacterized protein LOC111023525 [Momordica charantia]
MKIDSSVSCSALQPYSRQLVERGNDDKVPSPETTEEAVAGAVAVLPEPAVESVRRCFVLAFSASVRPTCLSSAVNSSHQRTLSRDLQNDASSGIDSVSMRQRTESSGSGILDVPSGCNDRVLELFTHLRYLQLAPSIIN